MRSPRLAPGRVVIHGAVAGVNPAAQLELDTEWLERFPVGYRHLAYLQTAIGYRVKPDMPGLRGPEVEELYTHGRAWLAGDPLQV